MPLGNFGLNPKSDSGPEGKHVSPLWQETDSTVSTYTGRRQCAAGAGLGPDLHSPTQTFPLQLSTDMTKFPSNKH